MTRTYHTTRFILSLTLALLVGGCSDNATTSEPSLGEAQAALLADSALVAVAASLPSWAGYQSTWASLFVAGKADFAGQLSDDALGAVAEQLNTLTAGNCSDVARQGPLAYAVSFTSCTFGTKGTLIVNGRLSVTFVPDLLKRSLAAVIAFDEFSVNGSVVNGSMKALLAAEATGQTVTLVLSTPSPLQIANAAGTQQTLSLELNVLLDANSDLVTLDGSGTLTAGQTAYALTFEQIKVRLGEAAPYAGTLGIDFKQMIATRSVDVHVELRFSQATVDNGTVQVFVNGTELGSLTPTELKALAAG